jgi:hypothetical protein
MPGHKTPLSVVLLLESFFSSFFLGFPSSASAASSSPSGCQGVPDLQRSGLAPLHPKKKLTSSQSCHQKASQPLQEQSSELGVSWLGWSTCCSGANLWLVWGLRYGRWTKGACEESGHGRQAWQQVLLERAYLLSFVPSWQCWFSIKDELVTLRNGMDGRRTYGSVRSIGDSALSFLSSLLLLFGSETVGEQCVEIVVVIPIIERVQLLLGFGFGLGSDLELETVRKVGLGRNVGKKMGDVGEGRCLGTETAGQFDGNFVFDYFRHVCNDCR